MFRDSLELLITNIKEQCPHVKIGYVTRGIVTIPDSNRCAEP